MTGTEFLEGLTELIGDGSEEYVLADLLDDAASVGIEGASNLYFAIVITGQLKVPTDEELQSYTQENSGEVLAQRFHETYERLAPAFGYETRKDSAVPWKDVPEKNRKLMIAVCDEIICRNMEKHTPKETA